MYSKYIVALGTAASAFGSAFAYSHGDISEFEGVQYKWQQLAPGHFTGVRLENWNETVHKPGYTEWVFDEAPESVSRPQLGNSEEELDRRDFNGDCQIILNCVINNGAAALGQVYSKLVTAATYAANDAGTDLLTFVQGPFVTTFIQNQITFITVSVVSNPINQAINQMFFAQCSSSNADVDVVNAVVSQALNANPSVGVTAVTITTPSGGAYTISIGTEPGTSLPPSVCPT